MNISQNNQLLSKIKKLSSNIKENRNSSYNNEYYKYTNKRIQRLFEHRNGNIKEYEFKDLKVNNEIKNESKNVNTKNDIEQINNGNKLNSEKKKNNSNKKNLKNKKEEKHDNFNYLSEDIKYQDNIIVILNSKIGLKNLGNTCYMNTCLQIIIHTPNFISRFFKNLDKINYLTPISQNFYDLILKFYENKNWVSPEEFLNVFCKEHYNFLAKKQNDTQEFCRIFLEDINVELNNIKMKTPYIELDTLNKNKIQCKYEYDNLYKQKDDSLIIDSFYGQIINTFSCKCGFQNFSFQKCFDIPLSIPYGKKSEDLNQLIKTFFEEEKIDIKCKNCSKKDVKNKKLFSQPPEILILSLQRLNERNKSKNTIKIKFEEELKMKNYIDNECFHNKNYNYVLYGIANHNGTIDEGHYYAYINIFNDWYEFNDSNVKKLKQIEHISSEAYIFFYKRNDI